jgi:prokaryotic ubiquitin-like protein Pup
MSQERVQLKKSASQQTSETESSPGKGKVDDAEIQRIKEETDELLDAIDAVLEENAEEFVAAYVQKGGE